MKRKLISLLLTLVLVASTVSAALTTTVLGDGTNIITPKVNNIEWGHTETVEYVDGQDVTITAVEEPGHCFVGWFEDSTDLSPFTTNKVFTITADRLAAGSEDPLVLENIEARFTPTIRPKVNNGDWGYTESVEFVPGQEVTLNAVPFIGYSFVGWYENSTATTPLCTDTMYTLTTDSLADIEARFAADSDSSVAGLGFEEGYTVGDTIVSYKDGEDSTLVKGHEFVKLESEYVLDTETISVTDEAHSGEKALRMSGTEASFSYVLPLTLEKNTTYAVSFFIRGFNSNCFLRNIMVTDASVTAFNDYIDGEKVRKYYLTDNERVLGYRRNVVYTTDWQEVVITFNTGDSTNVRFWCKNDSAYDLLIDSINVFDFANVSVKGEPGGSISVSGLHDSYVLKGSQIGFHAKAEEGNTFAGWYDVADVKVSGDEDYYPVLSGDLVLTAKFDGANTPTRELFAENGMDGTFENGTISGWSAYHETDSVAWCSWDAMVPDETKNYFGYPYVYEGEKSLKVSGTSRTSILPLSKYLRDNTDYVFSMYMLLPNYDARCIVEDVSLVGDGASYAAFAQDILGRTTDLYAGTGWRKITFHFNSGEQKNIRLLIRFTSNNGSDNPTYMYLDNMFLYEYPAGDELKNSTFDDSETIGYWYGDDFKVENGAATLSNTGSYFYQPVSLTEQYNYTVNFRAKGNVFAAATEIGEESPDVFNAVTSQAMVTTSGDDWNDYSFTFYASDRKGANVAFKSIDGTGYVDDVTITSNADNSGAIVERLDFETDRNAIVSSNSDAWSIYSGSDGDDNVHSGTKSLKYTYTSTNSKSDNILNEEFLKTQLTAGVSYRMTFWYKSDSGDKGGTVYLSPEIDSTYGANKGYEYTPTNTDWQMASFLFTATTHIHIKTLFRTIAGSTNADFYFDDITLAIAEPSLTEDSTKYSYCEEIHNSVQNNNFEDATTDDDWGTLPSNMKVVSGNAQKGNNYLSVSAGETYLVKLAVTPKKEHTLGISMRASAAFDGYVGVALSDNISENTSWYCTEDGVPASRITLTEYNGEWQRKAFKFATNATGYLYLVINVTSGTLDIDNVCVFDSSNAYWYDPNDYTEYVPYDYDATTSSTCVINGGYGEQPYYKK